MRQGTRAPTQLVDAQPEERAPHLKVIEGGRAQDPDLDCGRDVVIGVIEDSTLDYYVIAKSVERLRNDWTTRQYATYEEGLAAVLEQDADIFLVDCVLPTGSGIELIREARSQGSRARLIMLTGAADEAVDADALDAGADDFLDKGDTPPRVLERAIRYGLRAKEETAELDAARLRYEAAIIGSNDGIWDVDLQTGELFVSPRCGQLLGLSEHQSVVDISTLGAVFEASQLRALLESVRDHVTGGAPMFSCEMQRVGLAGPEWLFARGVVHRDSNGEPLRFAGSLADVTDRRQLQDAAQYQAMHDGLTGLPNRTYLEQRVRAALGLTQDLAEYGVTLVYIDLDGFKPVNDKLGHAAGDLLLRAVAARLRHATRESDLAARIGGDEFIVLVEDCHKDEDVQSVIRKLQLTIDAPYTIGEELVTISASIGVASETGGLCSFDDLIQRADESMYRAKRLRTSAWKYREHAAPSGLGRRNELASALDGNEIVPHFQRIVSLDDHAIVGWEALARWERDGRVVSPHEFLGELSSHGLERELGRAILRHACDFISMRSNEEWVSVNVTANHLLHPEFVSDVVQALDSRSLNGQRLRLEVVEQLPITDIATAAQHMSELWTLGVRFSLDDFGTGYCAPELLLDLPVSAVKIDRSLIGRLTDSRGRDLVDSLLSLAHRMDLQVIAEGIEDVGGSEYLSAQGVTMGQGYLFGKAESPALMAA